MLISIALSHRLLKNMLQQMLTPNLTITSEIGCMAELVLKSVVKKVGVNKIMRYEIP